MKYLAWFTFGMIAMILPPAPAQALDFAPYVGVGLGGFTIEKNEVVTFVVGAPQTISSQSTETVFGGHVKVGADFPMLSDIPFGFGAEIRGGQTSTGTSQGNSPFGPTETNFSLDYFAAYLVKVRFQPFEDNENLKLKIYAGGTTAKFSTEFLVAGAVVSTTIETKTAMSYGAGIEYRIMDHLIIEGEWLRYWDQVAPTGTLDTTSDGFEFSVRYEF